MRRASALFVWMAMYCSGMGTTPLIDAARTGDTVRIRQLVANGASPNQRGGVNDWTALEHAVHKNQLRSVQALLDAGANPNTAGGDGRTPLIMAAGYGYTPIVELLLRRGADPRLTDAHGHNALDAAKSGTSDIDRFTLFDKQDATVAVLRKALTR